MSKLEDFLYLNQNIIGVDEVGRGPLAGPVVACAVGGLISKELLIQLESFKVTDSKKLTKIKREKIIHDLKIDLSLAPGNLREAGSFLYCIEEINSEVIDKINIFQSSMLAMSTASVKLKSEMVKVDNILVDGKFPLKIEDQKSEAIIKGDSRFLMIGLASIIAKVYRDQLMQKYATKYPGYGLEQHAGYPTKKHKEAIRKLGITPIHRKSFRGVSEFVK